MRSLVIVWWAAVALSSAATLAIADDECAPNTVEFDVCEYAKKVQEAIAPSLPQALSGEMSLQQILAAGPMLAVVVTWNYDSDAVDHALALSGMTRAELYERMDILSERMVCGQDVLAAFVRLGGTVQYKYRTLDAFPLHSPTIAECEVH